MATRNFLEYLCINGGDINYREGKSGRTLLHWAVVAQKVDMVQFLLNYSSHGLRVNAKSYAGHTPLDLAWNLFQVVPNNNRVRNIIVLLMENGGEPKAAPLTSDSDSDSNVSDSSDEDTDCSATL